MPSIPTVTLAGGIAMPQLGFGVYKVPADETAAIVTTAIEAGYRSIDTATLYGNERGVGEAVRTSDVPRDELFVTTKLWNDDQGRDATLAAFDRSLAELGLDHVDLYLVHWPAPAQDRYVETWRALQEIHASGRARAIGVSNFQPAHLARVVEETGVVPAVNQIELHPHLQQAELRAVHERLGIVTEAWSPIGRGRPFDEPAIVDIAARHGRTPAQVVLRWHLQLGTVAIPKSVTPARIRENLDVTGFELTDEDLARIADLDAGIRSGPDPDTFG